MRVTTSIIRLNKYRNRWAEHAVLIREQEMHNNFCIKKRTENISCENLQVDGVIMLKWIVQK